MPKPWERPPLPDVGDEDENVTYMLVGRIMSRWEAIEFELSRLHSCFAGAPDAQEPVAEYGGGTTFRIRAEILERGAEAYFVRNCDQQRETDFAKLLELARGYSNRRNDVAHGILFRIDNLTFFRDRIRPDQLHRPHHAIIPPLYFLKGAQGGTTRLRLFVGRTAAPFAEIRGCAFAD